MKTAAMETQELITIVLIGLGAGILSGLVGIGGGIVMVPAMVFFLSYTQHQAQGTSLAVLTLPVVLLAAINYYLDGKKSGAPIDLRVVAILSVGFVVGAYAGSKWALRIDQGLLKKLFGILLLYTSIKMLSLDSLILKWVKGIF